MRDAPQQAFACGGEFGRKSALPAPRCRGQRIFTLRVQPGNEFWRGMAGQRHERPRPGGSWGRGRPDVGWCPIKTPTRHCLRCYRYEVDRSLAGKSRPAANLGPWSVHWPKLLSQAAVEPKQLTKAAKSRVAAMPPGSVRHGWRLEDRRGDYGAEGPRDSFFAASSSRYSRQYFSRLRPSSNR